MTVEEVKKIIDEESLKGGNLFETDTTQWALRQAWHL